MTSVSGSARGKSVGKASRRARKKHNRAMVLHCDGCKQRVTWVGEDGSHDTNLSISHWTWDGLCVVAWCPFCGSDTAS